ncbi:hypothetical protein ACFVS2_26925 [Brevibacillus sp. NPDC058079]|uniref:hypothetical protein n=1 Tax=Brevibacillus sp. NPDC058079 TaxID=3346330 RepID=UPI0036ED1145
MVWDQKGIPHKGWTCIGMIDLGEDLDGVDAESRRDYYETCQMCKHEGIRYVHIMQHPNYDLDLRVGQQCAENMEEDYTNPKKRETSLKNKHNRRVNFMRKEWTRNKKGNFTLKYKGQHMTIMPSKFAGGGFGIIFNNESMWNIKGEKIKTFENAKAIAFTLLDNYLMES